MYDDQHVMREGVHPLPIITVIKNYGGISRIELVSS
jgi:hypothetical protein